MTISAEQIIGEGYLEPKLLATGEWAALSPQIFTIGIAVGLDDTCYRTRYCYELYNDAADALSNWDGRGDPPGPWIKEKGAVERLGPGAFA